MRALSMAIILALAGCASTPEPVVSPEPILGSGPDLTKVIGHFEIDLNVTPSGTTAPATVEVTATIRTTNAVGQSMEGNVSWRLVVEPGGTRTGNGNSLQETWELPERGAYRVTLNVTAPRYHAAEVTHVVTLDPPPLAGEILSMNATRGAWFTLQAQATQGYSDLGYTCNWAQSDALQIVAPGTCQTQARWLEDGNQTAMVTIDDGVANVTVSQAVAVDPATPLTMPTAAPADSLIVDDPGETQPAPLNITHAWFASDLDHLYIGLAVQDIPDPDPTRGTRHTVTFQPSWDAKVAGSSVEAFRATATHPMNADGPNVDGVRFFDLEARVDGDWQTIGAVDAAVSTDNDLFWWPVLRSDIQAPLTNATISGLSATASGATDDEASTSATYRLY